MKRSIVRKPLAVFGIGGLLLGVIALVTPAQADYIPLPIKWSQPIGFTTLPDGTVAIAGVDRLSDHTVNVIRADDFQCRDPEPIVAVRWWGSYIDSTVKRPDGFTGPFDISFHLSTFPVVPHPFSLPVDGPIYFATVSAQEVFVGIDVAGDFVYRYDAYLPTPFNQQFNPTHPNEYFLDIDKPTHESWGWHESPFGGLDYPALGPTHGGPWTSDPPHDLAFELMVIPEPSALLLVVFGGAGLLALRRRR